MPKRKISTEPIKQLLIELPLSEYQELENPCRDVACNVSTIIAGDVFYDEGKSE